MRKSYLFLTLLFCVLHSLLFAQNSSPKFLTGITYANVDSIALQLNIALPILDINNPDIKYPLLIFIHGGGWREGHRNAYNGQIKTATQKGYVAATISHRLTAIEDKKGIPLHPWPAAIYDCKAAVRYLKANAKKYHIDTTKIGVTGASSGGHLSLMMGLTKPEHGLDGAVEIVKEANADYAVSSSVQAVVNISGPTEMISCHKAPIVTHYFEYLLEGSPTDNISGYIQSSPVSYLRKDMVPIMTLHGKLDDVVPFEQAIILDYKIKALGGFHKLYSFDDQGHIFKGDAAQESWQVLYDFFDEHLK